MQQNVSIFLSWECSVFFLKNCFFSCMFSHLYYYFIHWQCPHKHLLCILNSLFVWKYYSYRYICCNILVFEDVPQPKQTFKKQILKLIWLRLMLTKKSENEKHFDILNYFVRRKSTTKNIVRNLLNGIFLFIHEWRLCTVV